MNGSENEATDFLPWARHRWCSASIEPSASPSGPTWHASARESASVIAATARSMSSVPIIGVQCSQDRIHVLTTGYRRIGDQGKIGRPLEPDLAHDRGTELD